METVGARLKRARREQRMTQSELAKRAELSQATVAHLESERNVSSRHAHLLAKALGVSVEWLMTGVEAPSTRPNGQTDVTVWNNREDLEANELVWIDAYDMCFSAGNGTIQWEVRQKNALPFNRSFFQKKGVKPDNCKLLVTRGDSMEPYLFDDDLFMIDSSDKQLRDGQVYAIHFDEESLVKQVFKLPGGGIRLHSINSHRYPDLDITGAQLEFVQVVGRVIYRSG